MNKDMTNIKNDRENVLIKKKYLKSAINYCNTCLFFWQTIKKAIYNYLYVILYYPLTNIHQQNIFCAHNEFLCSEHKIYFFSFIVLVISF